MDRAPYHRLAGLKGRNRTRTAKNGGHISPVEEEKGADGGLMSPIKLGKPTQADKSTFQARILSDTPGGPEVDTYNIGTLSSRPDLSTQTAV